MPVQHTFDFIPSPGREFVKLEDWVLTLSAEDRSAYAVAEAAHQALLRKQEADGDLITNEVGKKVYTDEAIERAKRGEFQYVPAEWLAFFERYQRETGMTLDRSVEKL